MYNQGWYYEEDQYQAFIMEKSLEQLLEQDLDRNRIKYFTADGKTNENQDEVPF